MPQNIVFYGESRNAVNSVDIVGIYSQSNQYLELQQSWLTRFVFPVEILQIGGTFVFYIWLGQVSDHNSVDWKLDENCLDIFFTVPRYSFF